MNGIAVARDLGAPLHHQIYLVLADGIAKGRYGAGELLPTEEQLTKLFRVSRITVRRAFDAQDALNQRLNPAWFSQGWDYYRAAWTEAAEAVEHANNWVWWKKGAYGKPLSGEAVEQIQLELVDILHFGLSMEIIEAKKFPSAERGEEYLNTAAEEFITSFAETPTDALIPCLEKVVHYLLTYRVFPTQAFCHACINAGMTLPKMLAMFYAKQALNDFRWSHGYNLPKEDPKTYRKMWPAVEVIERGGYIEFKTDPTRMVEDNVHLAQITKFVLSRLTDYELSLLFTNGMYKETIMAQLESRYDHPAGM